MIAWGLLMLGLLAMLLIEKFLVTKDRWTGYDDEIPMLHDMQEA